MQSAATTPTITLGTFAMVSGSDGPGEPRQREKHRQEKTLPRSQAESIISSDIAWPAVCKLRGTCGLASSQAITVSAGQGTAGNGNRFHSGSCILQVFSSLTPFADRQDLSAVFAG